MKNVIGIVLTCLGLLCIFTASNMTKKAESLPELMGTFVPGILLLAIGVALRQPGALLDGDEREAAQRLAENRQKSRAEMGIVGGIVLMFLGSGVSQQGRELFLIGLSISVGGWLLMIWGAVIYALWKGYSAWFGLFGLLIVPGLIVLACLPNKTKRFELNRSIEPSGERPLPPTTRTSVSIAAVMLVSLVVILGLFSSLFLAGPRLRATLARSKPDVSWSWLVVDSPKSTIEMPENRKVESLSQETPSGTV